MDIVTVEFGNRLVIDYRGKPVTISFFDLPNEQIKIGIDADKSVAIYREEIYQHIKKGQK